MTRIEKQIVVWVLVILMLITISSNLAMASDPNDTFDNIYIDFHSVNMIRNGYTFPASITIRNLDENKTLDVKKVTILNEGKKIVKTKSVDKTFKSLRNSLKREKELREYLQKPEFCESPESIKEIPEFREYLDTISTIKNETFRRSFELDIGDFDDNIWVGKTINILIEIEVKIGNDKHIVSRESQIKVVPPLPKPPHNSPGWYAGDQHMHSEYGTTLLEYPAPLGDMVNAAVAEDLDWVIFTDHSPAFSEASEWEAGRDACTDNSTSTFKCLYGQEMSIGQVPWLCDTLGNSHYLAHPSSDDDIGYIDGYCGFFQCDDCRLEQPVVNEINNAGGIGFIAHPYDDTFDWKDWTVTGYSGLEIFNAKDGIWDSDDQDTLEHWEGLLQDETDPDDGFFVGIGGSDAHETNEVGYTFTYCYLESETLTTTGIRNSYKDGHCVISNGPFLSFTLDSTIIGDKATVPEGTNTLDIIANSTGFGELEWLFLYINDSLEDTIPLSGYYFSSSFDVSLSPEDGYIRLELYTDDNHRAYTNPIWLNVTSCSCGGWSEGSCGGGSCNSEQKESTRSCTPSACAYESKCEYDEDCEESAGKNEEV